MAKWSDILEGGLMPHKRMEKLFPEGASLDTNRRKHVKYSINLLESGELYDTHELIITLVSDEELSFLINVRAVIAAVRDLKTSCAPCEQELGTNHILSVVDDPPVFNEDKTQVDIRFQVINNITRKLR
jgi:hypothetical protein